MAETFKPLLNKGHSNKKFLYLRAYTLLQQSPSKSFEEKTTYECVTVVFHVLQEKYQE